MPVAFHHSTILVVIFLSIKVTGCSPWTAIRLIFCCLYVIKSKMQWFVDLINLYFIHSRKQQLKYSNSEFDNLKKMGAGWWLPASLSLFLPTVHTHRGAEETTWSFDEQMLQHFSLIKNSSSSTRTCLLYFFVTWCIKGLGGSQASSASWCVNLSSCLLLRDSVSHRWAFHSQRVAIIKCKMIKKTKTFFMKW